MEVHVGLCSYLSPKVGLCSHLTHKVFFGYFSKIQIFGLPVYFKTADAAVQGQQQGAHQAGTLPPRSGDEKQPCLLGASFVALGQVEMGKTKEGGVEMTREM